VKKVLIIFLLIATSLVANSAEEGMLEASNTMKKLVKSQDGIPMSIIQNAQAIIVIPEMERAGFFVGFKYGEGVASIKKADGNWSYPFFIKFGGGNLGLQFGYESSESILVFRTKNSAKELLGEKFTLGAEVSVSVGPLSANVDKSTEVNMLAEVYTYSKTKGFFAGATLNGASITSDDEKNRILYGDKMNVKKVVSSENLSEAYGVLEFIKTINSLMER